MTSQQILESEADEFVRFMRDYFREVDGPERFKQEVESKLYNYYESVDKLIFLSRLNKNISEKYDKHLEKCEHKEQPEKCSANRFYAKAKFFIEQEIRQLNTDFDYTVLRPTINADLIRKNLVQLSDFPRSGKLFQDALDKLNSGLFERNVLDDLRLSLEHLLKDILKNDKSLENQIDSLGLFLKNKATSKEVSNMLVKLIEYYSKYHNSYIKHNDKVNEGEVELIINLTSSFVGFLISK